MMFPKDFLLDWRSERIAAGVGIWRIGERRVVEACGVEDDRFGGYWSVWFGS